MSNLLKTFQCPSYYICIFSSKTTNSGIIDSIICSSVLTILQLELSETTLFPIITLHCCPGWVIIFRSIFRFPSLDISLSLPLLLLPTITVLQFFLFIFVLFFYFVVASASVYISSVNYSCGVFFVITITMAITYDSFYTCSFDCVFEISVVSYYYFEYAITFNFTFGISKIIFNKAELYLQPLNILGDVYKFSLG